MQKTNFLGEIFKGPSIGDIDGTGFSDFSIPGEVPTVGIMVTRAAPVTMARPTVQANSSSVMSGQPTASASANEYELAFFRCRRALEHLMNKNHKLIPSECDGCKEIALFLTEPGYRGDERNPVGVDGDRY